VKVNAKAKVAKVLVTFSCVLAKILHHTGVQGTYDKVVRSGIAINTIKSHAFHPG